MESAGQPHNFSPRSMPPGPPRPGFAAGPRPPSNNFAPITNGAPRPHPPPFNNPQQINNANSANSSFPARTPSNANVANSSIPVNTMIPRGPPRGIPSPMNPSMERPPSASTNFPSMQTPQHLNPSMQQARPSVPTTPSQSQPGNFPTQQPRAPVGYPAQSINAIPRPTTFVPSSTDGFAQFGNPAGFMPPSNEPRPQAPMGFTPGHAPSATMPASGVNPRNLMVSIEPGNQCPQSYSRLTFDKFPESESVRQRAGNMPLAAIYRPFSDLPGTEPVPVVNFGSNAVVRCRRCRSYISPFAIFIENGRRWQCALCWNVNEVEPEYFCPINPETGKRRDHYERPELNSGIIDILAPEEYTLRPPPSTRLRFCD